MHAEAQQCFTVQPHLQLSPTSMLQRLVDAPAGDLNGCFVTLNLAYGLKLINNISLLQDIDTMQQIVNLLALAAWSNNGCLARQLVLIE